MESCCHTEATTNNFPAIRAAQLMNRKKEAALEERGKQLGALSVVLRAAWAAAGAAWLRIVPWQRREPGGGRGD